MTHKAKTTGRVDWYTPPHILDLARDVLGGGFTFDPASSATANKTVQADHYLSVDDDALAMHTWPVSYNSRVWMNPPYARRVIGMFVDKFIAEARRTHFKGAVLVNTDSGTKWFQALLAEATAVTFLRGRLAFIDGNTGLPCKGGAYAQALFWFGVEPDIGEEHGVTALLVQARQHKGL